MSPADFDGRPLRVHFFTTYSHPQGTYFRFHNLAVGLARLGHDVTVFAADHDYRARTRWETRDGIPYHLQAESKLIRAFGHNCDPLTIARRAVRRYPKCDVAHLFQPFPSAAAGWIRSPAGARFYDWDDLWWGGIIQGPAARWRENWERASIRFLEGRLPRKADHVTAIGEFLGDLARERGAKGVTVVNSGSWPANGPRDRQGTRERLGLRRDSFYVGFMGRTTNELPWCFEALSRNSDRYPQLRLAICGAPEHLLDGLSPSLRERIDYLGQIGPVDAAAFASCLDLGLLPLGDDGFNRSRLPQKFGDHLGTGVPLLCSRVGECARLIGQFPWAIPAGTNREQWLQAFGTALDRVIRGEVPAFDPELFSSRLSWEGLSRRLAATYREVLSKKSAAPDDRS